MKADKILKPFALFLCLILLPCLLLAGSFFQEGLYKDIYREWLKIKKPPWQGVLSVWHVAGWDGATGSVSYWLGRRVREYERENTGVFLEIQTLSANELKRRLSQGSFPDILSFPTGAAHTIEACMSEMTPNTNIRSEFLQSAMNGEGSLCAEPYAFSGYILAANDDMLYERQLQPPPQEGWSPEELKEAVTKAEPAKNRKKAPSIGLCASNEECIAFASLASYWAKKEVSNAVEMLQSGKAAAGNPVDEFARKNTVTAILSLGELRKLRGIQSQGKAPYCSVCPVSSFTDMVQYIGFKKGEPPEKSAICQAFADFLLADKAQESLKDIGAFPVSQKYSNLYETDELLTSIEQAYQKDVLVPNAFDYVDRRIEIKGLIDKTLSGSDKTADILHSVESACKR